MKNRGITLIALVVTIIVLLILAGISISMLTGQNGIINRANEAKNTTEEAQEEEKIKLAVMSALTKGTGTLTIPNLKNELSNYGIEIAEDVTFPVTVSKNEKNYVISSTGTVTVVPNGFEIGSTVTYSPSGTYNWQAKYCSSDKTENIDDEILNASNHQRFNLTEWNVLSIEDGKVELVPTKPTSGTVYLGQAQGYNNGVKLLNEACSNLYSNASKGITARSLNIEDIEKYMSEDKLTVAHSYSNAAKYEEMISSPYTSSNSYYPSIYAKENLSVINGRKAKADGLGMSEQNSFIERTDNEATEGKITTATSIQPYQTYWNKDNSYMQTAFKTANNGKNYYDLLIPQGPNTIYWLASRCVNTSSNYCDFRIRCVYSGDIGSYNMYSSNDAIYCYAYALFPVVSLSSELIEGNKENGFKVNVD